ncbi:hypothetical protein [Pseudomonas aeruginosa]|uniref:hypothetical protein n=1 Tax=Pseudomonas aeruginosa TaxID=287 RepID=UPI000A834A3F|nr:hypothetical protein [Pseudomonas aeruginosa]
MLETAPHEHNYLIDHLDEIEAVIVDLSFNVQDDRWLVYCTACGLWGGDCFDTRQKRDG